MTSSVFSVKKHDIDFHVPNSHKNRSYQLVQLPNGLQALAINDSSSELFSAAMVVGSGSANDPDDALGLAHLCEHMLFLGTKSFPIPNQLDQIVSSAGGFSNAYTTLSQTCYHFEVSSYAKMQDERAFIIDSVLEIFSSFFKCPLMKEKYIKGEIKAVDEEHRGNMNDMDKILLHAIRLLSAPHHVFSRFGTGNRGTLSKLGTKKLQRYLRAYFQHFYTAPKMALVVKGPQSINHLVKLIVTHFSDVPGSPLEHTRLSNSSFVSDHDIYFSPQLHGYLSTSIFDSNIKAIVLKNPNTSRVRLCYLLEEINALPYSRRTKSLLCNLIGDESKNSLCDYFKRKKQWATLILVFTQNTIFDDDVLIVEMDVTPSGLRQILQLVDTLHYFINYTIGGGASRDFEKVVQDFTKMEDKLFRERGVGTTFVDEICDYAERLEKGSLQHANVIRGFEEAVMSNEVDLNEIRKATLQCINEEKLKIVIAHKDFSPSLALAIESKKNEAKVEQYFQFEYCEVKADEHITFVNPDLSVNLELPHIPDRLKEHDLKRKDSVVGNIRGIVAPINSPTLIHFENSLEIWRAHHNEEEKCFISLHIQFRKVENTVENQVGIELLAEILGEKLKTELYHHELVGSFWGIFPNINSVPSLLVSVSGTKAESMFLILRINYELRDPIQVKEGLRYQTFKRARVNLRERFEETLNASGLRKVNSAAYLLLEEGVIRPEDKVDALELLDSTFLQSLAQELFEECPYYQILFEGDITKEESQGLANDLSSLRSDHYLSEILMQRCSQRSYILPEGKTVLFQMEGLDDDTANTVLYYLQLGDRCDLEIYTWGRLLEHILSYTALDELRTNRGIAYAVFTGMKFFRNTFGIHLAIPSGEYECEEIIEEIERFFGVLQRKMTGYTEEYFKEEVIKPFQETLHQSLNHIKTPSGLFISLQPLQGSGDKPDSTAFLTHWSHMDQVINGTFRFGGSECEEPIDEEYLESITLKSFLHYYHMYISPDSSLRSCLIIANSAGIPLYETRKLQFATAIYAQLLAQDMDISQPQIMKLLERCDDQENFSDMPVLLKSYFRESKQGTRLMKLAFRNFAFSLLRGATSKLTLRPKHPTSDGYSKSRKLQIREVQEIHNICCVNSPISWYEKIETMETLAHHGNGTAQF